MLARQSRHARADVRQARGGQGTERIVRHAGLVQPELAHVFFEAGPARAIQQLSDWLAEETRRGRLIVTDPDFAAEQFFALCQTRLVLRQKLALLDAPVAMFLRFYAEGGRSASLARYLRGNDG